MKNGGAKASAETFKAVMRATISPTIETAADDIKKVYDDFIKDLPEDEENI